MHMHAIGHLYNTVKLVALLKSILMLRSHVGGLLVMILHCLSLEVYILVITLAGNVVTMPHYHNL